MAISYIYTGINRLILDVEIANGASVSDTFEVPNGMAVVGILPPSAWTAADLAFKVAALQGDAALGPAKGIAGAAYLKCAIAASVPVAIPQTNSIHWPYQQLLSCTANNATDVTPVNQAAKRTIRLLLQRILPS